MAVKETESDVQDSIRLQRNHEQGTGVFRISKHHSDDFLHQRLRQLQTCTGTGNAWTDLLQRTGFPSQRRWLAPRGGTLSLSVRDLSGGSFYPVASAAILLARAFSRTQTGQTCRELTPPATGPEAEERMILDSARFRIGTSDSAAAVGPKAEVIEAG